MCLSTKQQISQEPGINCLCADTEMLRWKSRDYRANTLHQVQLQSVDLVFLWSVLLSAFESDAEFFGCYCTEICCVSSVKGAIWVCRLLSVHSTFINKERFVWLQWHSFNQLPADSTLLFPGCLKDAVGFSRIQNNCGCSPFPSPMLQLWEFHQAPERSLMSRGTQRNSRNNSDLYAVPDSFWIQFSCLDDA